VSGTLQESGVPVPAPRAPVELQLFALESARAFGEQVAAHIGIGLSPHEERAFEDGEHKSRPLVNVRGNDVFVLHSLYADKAESVNDKLCRLLFLIGALHDAAAASVTAVVPYLCYARKDRKSKPRDPVTSRYVAALFEAVGTHRIVTMDVHNLAAYQNAFRCGADHLEALPLLVAHFAPVFHLQPLTVVSPDIGGVKRVERFREALVAKTGGDVTTAFMEKQRSAGVVSGERLFGDVRDRAVLILDDLISTGTTVSRAAAACHAGGARSVRAAATHGLFLGNAPRVLAEARLDELVVTNTVPPFRMTGRWAGAHLTVLDTSAVFAAAIERMHTGGSLVALLEG
jgi:ribose-phosphate pyrophosphokinase